MVLRSLGAVVSSSSNRRLLYVLQHPSPWRSLSSPFTKNRCASLLAAAHSEPLPRAAAAPATSNTCYMYSTTINAQIAKRRTFTPAKKKKGPKTKRRSEKGATEKAKDNQKRMARRKSARRKKRMENQGGGGGGGGSLGILPSDMNGATSHGKSSNRMFQNDFLDNYFDDDDMAGAHDYDEGGRRKLFYYQVDDEDGLGDVPSSVREKMNSDPSYFHGMEGLAANWSDASQLTPYQEDRVQQVLKDILERNKRTQEKKSSDGWEHGVILRLPKKQSDVTTSGTINNIAFGPPQSELDESISNEEKEEEKEEEVVSKEEEEDVVNDVVDAMSAEPVSANAGINALKDTSRNDDSENTDTTVSNETTKQDTSRLNNYQLYARSIRADVVEENPGLSAAEINKITGSRWRSLSDEERQQWTDRVGVRKKNTLNSGVAGYHLYASKTKEELKESNPEMSAGELQKEAGAKWRELSSEEQQVWKDKAAERYHRNSGGA